jgi:hypothetical protein
MINPAGGGRAVLLWVAALALTLAVLGVDSAQRLESIREITARRSSDVPEPEPDPRSPSGYAWGQHRAILPAIDGYHWILQTERMLSGGGLRIRTADYDDAPVGREVHWSGVMRWWSGGLAAGYRALHPELSAAQALERVTPWANTAILLLVLLAVTPLLALRFGAAAAACFALGTVAVFPFYEYFVVGYFDHHGVATMGAMLAVLCLAVGGAGWVRDEAGAPGTPWLPTSSAARRWFVASAVCAAVSLWVNAATVVPALVGVGLGALVVTVWIARGTPAVEKRIDPTLWRLWGWTGSALSLAFYLLEYFPGQLGLRLEVNHPLYGLAWLAGGDLLCRVGTAAREGSLGRGRAAWLALDVLAIALLPALILVTGERTFRLADPFLYTLHQRFIIEFLPLGGQLAAMSPSVIAGRASALPLLALPLAAALWPTELMNAWRWSWRAVLLLGVAVVMVYTHVVMGGLLGGRTALVFVFDAVVLAAGFALFLVRGARPLAAPTRAALILALGPALLLIGMSLAQVRWVGVASALWLGVLVVAAAVLPGAGLQWSWARRATAGAILAAVFVVAPAFFLPLPLDRADPPQEVARDASWWLRRRVGGAPAVVFTSPNATTWMAYFGGFPGVGTLYWENLDGLRAATGIYTAPSPDSLRGLLSARGVTHLVLYPWDRGFELLRLAREESGAPSGPEPYLAGLVRAMRAPGLASLPAWLTPLPYSAPPVQLLGHPSALILEVVPEQPPELALVRLAQYHQAIGAPDETEAALRASLDTRPSAAAWAMLAQLETARGGGPGAADALAGLRRELGAGDALETVDRVNVAIALALGRDGVGTTRELDAALAEADERTLRRLSPDQLGIVVRLARQLGLDRAHPEAIAIAESLLPPGAR